VDLINEFTTKKQTEEWKIGMMANSYFKVLVKFSKSVFRWTKYRQKNIRFDIKVP